MSETPESVILGFAERLSQGDLEGDGEGPDGRVEMSGTSADVLRRQADGSWRVVIDDPWGGSTG